MFSYEKTYMDFNDVERKETFYFNLTKAELANLELTTPGGFQAYLQKIMDSKDLPSLIKTFKDIIDMSYGIKSEDGRRFIKSTEILEEFRQTNAYSEIFMELATDADKASIFIKHILPNIPEIDAPNEPKLPPMKEVQAQSQNSFNNRPKL